MSAYIVHEKVMHRVVSAILASGEEWFMGRLISRSTPPAMREISATRIGRRLYALNALAVRQRYPHEPAYGSRPRNYAWQRHDVSPEQGVKCLTCLLYQCSEGRVYGYGHYRELQQMQGILSYNIVKETPGYAQASWG